MKSLAIGAAILLAALLFQYLRSRTTHSSQREFKTTDEFMQWLAAEAVKDAETGNGVKLDYTPESIKSVEQILGKLHEQYVKAPSSISVTGLAAAYGAYIGEVIRKTEPNVHWERDDELGQKIYPLVWGRGHVYPMGWCQKRIENGDEDNVWDKYTIFKQNFHLLPAGSRKGE